MSFKTIENKLNMQTPKGYVLVKDLSLVDSEESKSDVSSMDLVKSDLLGNGSHGVRARADTKVTALPPALSDVVRYQKTFGFRTTSSIAARDVTFGYLMAIAGNIAYSSTLLGSVASSVRLKSITIWPAEGSVTNNPEIAFTLGGTAFGSNPDKGKFRPVPSGVTIGGGFRFIPPKLSLASFWQNSALSTTTAFTMYDIPSGSIIYLNGEWTMRNSIAGITTTVVTASAGNFYYGYLDGPTAHLCLPLAVPSTF